jgi:hypothetical protein
MKKRLTFYVPVFKSAAFLISELKKINKKIFFEKCDLIISLNSVSQNEIDALSEINESVILIKNSEPLSINENWTLGLARIKTDYFKINSSNDPFEYEKILEIIENIPEGLLLMGKTKFKGVDNKWVEKVNAFRTGFNGFNKFEKFRSFFLDNSYGDISGYVFPYSVVEEINIRKKFLLTPMQSFPDYGLILMGISNSKSVITFDEDFGFYIADQDAPVNRRNEWHMYYREYRIERLARYIFDSNSYERKVIGSNLILKILGVIFLCKWSLR